MPTKKHMQQRAVSSIGKMALHWIAAGLVTMWVVKDYVISNGGTWPTGVSSFNYVKDLVSDFGGLGVFVSIFVIALEIFKSRKGDG